MMHRRTIGTWLLGAILTFSVTANATVWVVDFQSGPGTDFTDLPLALQAAADGDVLLVRGGIYTAWNSVDDRSLTLVGDGPFVQIQGMLDVRNLAAHRRVAMRNLRFTYGSQINLTNNQGEVWIENCLIQADLYGGSGAYGAVHAIDSRLVVVNSTVQGSYQYGHPGAPPTAGIYAVGSEVSVTGSTILGGGGLDTIYPDVPGADALFLDNSTLIAANSAFLGGEAGSQVGGDGVVAVNDSGIVLRNSTIAGGNGAPNGAASDIAPTSSLTQVLGSSHDLITSPTPVRVGTNFDLTVTGAVGDPVLLVAGVQPAFLPIGVGSSVALIDLPSAVLIPLGPIPAGGSIAISLPIPSLGATDALSFFLQDVYFDNAKNVVVFGPASVSTLLDASY